MVKRVITGAHYGLRDWLMQRITGVVMALYLLVFAVFLLTHLPLRYEDLHDFFGCQVGRLGAFLFLLSLYFHAWVGVRDVFMDYLGHVIVRLTAQVLAILTLTAYAAWSFQILWGIK